MGFFTLTTSFWQALGLNRNSLTLFWIKWCAIVVGLAAMGDKVTALGIPKAAEPYIALIAFCISVSAAQHRTSDLPATSDSSAVKLPPAAAWLLPLVLLSGFACVASSCASSQAVHIATTADTAIANALHQVYLDEGQAYKAGLYAKAQHDKYLLTIKAADQDAIALTDAIDAWRQSGADPKTVPAIVSRTKAGLQQVRDDLASLPASNPFIQALQAAIGLLGS